MQSYYEINVSLNGRHLFATAERSCTIRCEYEKVLNILKRKFPESEGYEVTATYWNCTGQLLETKRENKFKLIFEYGTYAVEFDSDENIVPIDIDRYDYGSSRTAFFVTDKSEIELNSIADGLGYSRDFEKELEKESDAIWLMSLYEDGNVIKSENCNIKYNITIE